MDFQTYTKERDKKLLELLEKQGISPRNPEDEASQQIHFEQSKFLSDERSSLVEFLLEEMPKKWGKLKGEDKEQEIHHRGYDEALNEVTALLESYLLWANSTAEV